MISVNENIMDIIVKGKATKIWTTSEGVGPQVALWTGHYQW